MRINCIRQWYLLTLAALLLPLVHTALYPASTWVIEERLSTGAAGDVEEGYEVVATADGGALVIGEVQHSTGTLSLSPAVTRLDPHGGIVWTRTYDITSNLNYSVKELSNGDIAWTCAGPGSNGYTIIVCRTNALGAVLWTTRIFCLPPPPPAHQHVNFHPREIIETLNGDLVVVGYREFPALADGVDIYLARLSGIGTLRWANTYDNPAITSLESGNGVVEGPNGNLYVCGLHIDPAIGSQHALIMRTNGMGVWQWTGHFGDGVGCEFKSLIYGDNGLLYAAGLCEHAVCIDSDIYVASVVPNTGALFLSYRYDVLDNDAAFDINFSLTKYNVVVTGLITDPPNGFAQRNSFAMELPQNLAAPLSFAQYGTAYEDNLRSIVQTPGNRALPWDTEPGYWMTGKIVTTAAPGTGADMYVLRAAPPLNTDCEFAPPVEHLQMLDEALVPYAAVACEDSDPVDVEDLDELMVTNKCPGHYTFPKRGAQDHGTNEQSGLATAAVSVAPNPIIAGQDLVIDFSSLGEEVRSVEIRDLQGRLLYRRSLDAATAVLRIASDGWAAGAYTLRVLTYRGIHSQQIMVAE